MNIINYVKGLFQTKPKDPINKISINVKKNGSIVIDMDLSHIKDEDAEQFAYMLFMLNEGRLCQTMLDLLDEFAHKNPDGIKFMEKTMLTWYRLIDAYEITLSTQAKDIPKTNEPVVPPSQFYQTIGYKGQ